MAQFGIVCSIPLVWFFFLLACFRACESTDPEIQKFEMSMTPSRSASQIAGPGDRVLEINLGYLTGSKRKPGDIEYSRPGLTISGGLTYALTNLRNANYFANPLNVNVKVDVYIAETYGNESTSLSQIAKIGRASCRERV